VACARAVRAWREQKVALRTHLQYTTHLRALERARIGVRDAIARGAGHRDQMLKTGHTLQNVILNALNAKNPPLPIVYLDEPRRTLRPLCARHADCDAPYTHTDTATKLEPQSLQSSLAQHPFRLAPSRPSLAANRALRVLFADLPIGNRAPIMFEQRERVLGHMDAHQHGIVQTWGTISEQLTMV
jgi:hypothetical protein